jgi:hypothetical protein
MKKLEESLERNRRSRLAWIDTWVAYMKRVPNQVWSEEQRIVIDSILQSANEARKARVL